MTDWIILTPSLLCESLTTAQTETLAARPHQATPLDPLAVAIGEATERVRGAIRANGLNRLSADPQKIPRELQEATTTFALLRLSEIWPLFQPGSHLELSLVQAENTLHAVSENTLPISLPSDPEPEGAVRRSPGVCVERLRTRPLGARRLRGL